VNHFSTLRGVFLIGALVLPVVTLNADTLILRDGRRVQGQLISFQNGFIEFQDSAIGGRVIRLDRDQVLGIEFGRVERNRPGYSEAPQVGRPRGLRERQVMVVANVPWNDTGIDVLPGQSVYFEASGEIRWGGDRRARPAGEPNSPNNPARPIPNRPGASLIGRVAGSNDYFFVGEERGAIRMRSSGRLFLGVNDDALNDNTGYFQVIVYY